MSHANATAVADAAASCLDAMHSRRHQGTQNAQGPFSESCDAKGLFSESCATSRLSGSPTPGGRRNGRCRCYIVRAPHWGMHARSIVSGLKIDSLFEGHCSVADQTLPGKPRDTVLLVLKGESPESVDAQHNVSDLSAKAGDGSSSDSRRCVWGERVGLWATVWPPSVSSRSSKRGHHQ
jgi:hypothetical protein